MCEALVAVFDKYGDKKNRNKARFKFVLDKLGLEKIKELYNEEFSALEENIYAPIKIDKEEDPILSEYKPVDCDDDPEFQLWQNRNIETQKQEGFHNVQIKLILGDFSILQAKSLANMAENFAGSKLVATVNQNLMIPWVKENAFGNLFTELKKINLHKAGTEEIRDITCCPGSETCNLGIKIGRAHV